ncbi:hypothetical protein CAPTEDRAFT_225142 [Capitella teleta]|uniref:Uncharacterized protein n=1 Tax=Capitella teleta TaxID=283909 RepID=R7TTB0_CAPTE|nr:hypothetical protein CAPTEDRAFT_225142 [Capitella teleta]|eukprot:ELT96827.1 hypothetical protein CAPTEDRAFT_225142 [Capitella teleta]
MPHFPTSDPTIITCQAGGSWNSTGPSCSKFGIAPWWALFAGVVGGIILISCTIPRLYVCLCGHKENRVKIHPHGEVTADGMVILNPADQQHMAVYHGAQLTRNGLPPGAQAILLTGATANAVYPAKQVANGTTTNAVYPVMQANGTVLLMPGVADPGTPQKPSWGNRDKDMRRRQHMAFFRENNRQPIDDDILASEKATGNLYF